MTNKDLIHALALEMMVIRGYDMSDPNLSIEFDLSRNDSQISFVYQDVEAVLNLLEEYGYPVQESSDCGDVSIRVNRPPSGFDCNTSIQVSLGSNSNFADLKAFVSQLELMSTPDDADIDGHLIYIKDIPHSVVDRITCGDCGYEDYLTTPADHQCSYGMNL